MSLACLVCHGVESPSRSFRSYSISSSENEGRCSTIASCLASKVFHSTPTPRSCLPSSAKVTPQPATSNRNSATGRPRLERSLAMRRDLVRDWNFDEAALER